MNCKQCRSLILGQWDRELNDHESRMLADHLHRCPECLAFKNELQAMAGMMKSIPPPELSTELNRETLNRCHEMLRKTVPVKKNSKSTFTWFGVPRGVLTALCFLVAITLALILPGFLELTSQETPSAEGMLTLTLVLQNAVMLLISPILFRKYDGITFRNPLEVKNG
jgi:anti-sigma factor RsiW